ncbi:MAG: 23S rRNA (guanosine(2251)-2'-O)-methyltransferase RlmB [Deltaproteobacteria bacterium]|nr:23S rRNA (guanosine(2251)-2'-O)-methyltransferase RlmB [Deltaproteobacteria bacterium]
MSRVVFGLNPVLELLRTDAAKVSELILAQGRGQARLKEILSLARAAGVKVRRRPRQELDRLTGSRAHQGLAALTADFAYLALADLLDRPRLDLVVILDGIQDPRNLGSIARTSLAAGAQGLIIPKDRAAKVTPTALKASAGALNHLPVIRVTNLNQTARQLKEAGLWLLGGSPQAETSLFDLPDLPPRLAVIIGAEGRGLGRALAQKCDFLAALDLAGPLESLGASAAAAAILFEIVRQKRKITSNSAQS